MSYLTDEAMDEFAQWQHDTAWEFEPVEIPSESDYDDCVHQNATVTEYADKAGTFFAVWECPDCGGIGECGKGY
jgi:hypothetical protein